MGVRTIPHRLRSEAPGLLLLAFALAFNTILLAPEVHIERVPVNDLVFHIAASQRLGQGVANAEPFLDPWVSKWSLGFPVWRIYQPVPHLIAARDCEGLPGFAPPPARRRWLSSALNAATSKRHLRTYQRSSTGGPVASRLARRRSVEERSKFAKLMFTRFSAATASTSCFLSPVGEETRNLLSVTGSSRYLGSRAFDPRQLH
jgi:hypothetical protein